MVLTFILWNDTGNGLARMIRFHVGTFGQKSHSKAGNNAALVDTYYFLEAENSESPLWMILSFLVFSFLFISFPFLVFSFLDFFFLFISFFYIHYIYIIYIYIYTYIYSILFCFILFVCVSETSGASLLFSNRDITYPLGMGEVFVHVFGSGGVGIGWGLWCAGACHSIVTRRPLKS